MDEQEQEQGAEQRDKRDDAMDHTLHLDPDRTADDEGIGRSSQEPDRNQGDASEGLSAFLEGALNTATYLAHKTSLWAEQWVQSTGDAQERALAQDADESNPPTPPPSEHPLKRHAYDAFQSSLRSHVDPRDEDAKVTIDNDFVKEHGRTFLATFLLAGLEKVIPPEMKSKESAPERAVNSPEDAGEQSAQQRETQAQDVKPPIRVAFDLEPRTLIQDLFKLSSGPKNREE